MIQVIIDQSLVVSVAATVLEKLIATQLKSYLEKHKLLHPHQGAYCHGWSSDDIIFDLILENLPSTHK